MVPPPSDHYRTYLFQFRDLQKDRTEHTKAHYNQLYITFAMHFILRSQFDRYDVTDEGSERTFKVGRISPKNAIEIHAFEFTFGYIIYTTVAYMYRTFNNKALYITVTQKNRNVMSDTLICCSISLSIFTEFHSFDDLLRCELKVFEKKSETMLRFEIQLMFS